MRNKILVGLISLSICLAVPVYSKVITASVDVPSSGGGGGGTTGPGGSAWTRPNTTCGNLLCEEGECGWCSQDCTVTDCCGNGVCDAIVGETPKNCPQDCIYMPNMSITPSSIDLDLYQNKTCKEKLLKIGWRYTTSKIGKIYVSEGIKAVTVTPKTTKQIMLEPGEIKKLPCRFCVPKQILEKNLTKFKRWEGKIVIKVETEKGRIRGGVPVRIDYYPPKPPKPPKPKPLKRILKRVPWWAWILGILFIFWLIWKGIERRKKW